MRDADLFDLCLFVFLRNANEDSGCRPTSSTGVGLTSEHRSMTSPLAGMLDVTQRHCDRDLD